MPFAALVLEREPMRWEEMPAALQDWAQTVGIVAALGLLIWSISWVVQNRQRGLWPKTQTGWAFLTLVGLSAGCFILLGLTLLGRQINIRALAQLAPSGNPMQPTAGDWLFTLAGLSALLAASLPLLVDLTTRMRWARIWALSRLSLKEAIRSRVVLIFSLIALVFLFAEWFVPYKPEDQLRNYVAVIYKTLPVLFLLTASLLGSFSIPADIRSQSIHTVVTKPVEKFEIVLGRFIGYAILITVGLAVVSTLSLIYVLRGIHPDAQRESFKARVPVYGELRFEGRAGESVGRVWSYRKYIGGKAGRPGADEQYAVWFYDTLPGELAARVGAVRFEITFDIYRMTKGVENQGVHCNFLFADGRLGRDRLQEKLALLKADRQKYSPSGGLAEQVLGGIEERIQADYPGEGPPAVHLARALREERKKAGGEGQETTLSQEVEILLVALHGLYEPGTVEVKDYHTQAIDVPAILFRRLEQLEEADPRLRSGENRRLPQMQIWVSVDNRSVQNSPQMVGMARADLYLLADEKPFWQNFYKGIIGLWFTFLLALGIAVPCSTYLSGVISWLCTMFLFGAGLARDFVRKLAEGMNEGGGPMESIYRIFTHTFHSGQLEASPTTTTLRGVDSVYQVVFRLVYSVLPDVKRFYLESYVANGFDIAWGRVLFLDCFLPMIGYLIPWMILGYYLIKYREVANPN